MLRQDRLQVILDISHGRPISRIVLPHPLEEFHHFGSPFLANGKRRRSIDNVRVGLANGSILNPPQLLCAHSIDDPELIPVNPRILFPVGSPSAEHFPIDHGATEYVDLVVVSGLWMPEFGCLPVDGTDKGTDNRSGRVLYPSKSKVSDFACTLFVD